MELKKYIPFLLILLTSALFGQSGYRETIEAGRRLRDQERYEEAFRLIRSAWDKSGKNEAEIVQEFDRVIAAIQAQQERERQSRLHVESAVDSVARERILAREAKVKTDSLTELLKIASDSLKTEERRAHEQWKRAEDLVARGQRLFADIRMIGLPNPEEASLKQGLAYFTEDTLQQKRDYARAAVYFHLSQFVRTSAFTDSLLLCTRLGEQADAYFAEGLLDSARMLYMDICDLLDRMHLDAGYEKRQQTRITALKKRVELSEGFVVADGALVLNGDWWAVPQELLLLTSVKKIVFQNNAALIRSLPIDLRRFPHIDTLVLDRCPNFEDFQSWDGLVQLSYLRISNCNRIRRFNVIAPLPALQELILENNKELTILGGTDHLSSVTRLTLSNNPALEKIEPSLSIPRLEHVVLHRLALDSIAERDTHWPVLKTLHISNIDSLRVVMGLQRYPKLSEIWLSHVPWLNAFAGFSELPELTTLGVENTALGSLAHIREAGALDFILIRGNPILQALPVLVNPATIRRGRIENNGWLSVNAFNNADFLKQIKKPHIFGNRFIGGRYIGVTISKNRDQNYNYSSYTGEVTRKPYTGLYQIGLTIQKDIHYVTDWGDLLSLVPSINYISYRGSTPYKTDYWEAYRGGAPQPGSLKETYRFIPGNEYVDLQFFDLSLAIRVAAPVQTFGQAYAFLGGLLTYRFPGEVGGTIYDEKFTEPVGKKLKLGLTLGGGVAGYFNRFKVSAEFALKAPLVSDQSSEPDPKFVAMKTFYSNNGKTFSTTPIDNAFVILYEQETFPPIMQFTLGVHYLLHYR